MSDNDNIIYISEVMMPHQANVAGNIHDFLQKLQSPLFFSAPNLKS